MLSSTTTSSHAAAISSRWPCTIGVQGSGFNLVGNAPSPPHRCESVRCVCACVCERPLMSKRPKSSGFRTQISDLGAIRTNVLIDSLHTAAEFEPNTRARFARNIPVGVQLCADTFCTSIANTNTHDQSCRMASGQPFTHRTHSSCVVESLNDPMALRCDAAPPSEPLNPLTRTRLHTSYSDGARTSSHTNKH